MGYTNDPANSVIDRIRLKTGDIDLHEDGLTDEVYSYLYVKNGLSENKAAVEALWMLVAKYAHYCTERSGTYLIEAEKRYQNFVDLLEKSKDPNNGLLPEPPDPDGPDGPDIPTNGTSGGYAGGLSLEERFGAHRSSNPLRLGESMSRFNLNK